MSAAPGDMAPCPNGNADFNTAMWRKVFVSVGLESARCTHVRSRNCIVPYLSNNTTVRRDELFCTASVKQCSKKFSSLLLSAEGSREETYSKC